MELNEIIRLRLDLLKIAAQFEKDCMDCTVMMADDLFKWCTMNTIDVQTGEPKEVNSDPESN